MWVWCGYVVSTDPGPSAEEVGHVLLQVSVWRIIAFVNSDAIFRPQPLLKSHSRSYCHVLTGHYIMEAMLIMACYLRIAG